MNSILLFSEYLGCAVVFGFFIGVERQLRNSAVGLRTNTLVAAGAAIFVLIETMSGVKDSRVAAQIVSGIGFIGGGAILREGLTIRGVNTAATLWCSAAVGALCGSGLLAEGAIATAIILLANVALRPLSYRLTSQATFRKDAQTHYLLHFICKSADESRMRQLLSLAANRSDLLTKSIRSEEVPNTGNVSVKALLVCSGKADQSVETVVEALSADPSAVSIEWELAGQPDMEHEK
jgi:putative Mg2+ transporter-C (MgtC) family protein